MNRRKVCSLSVAFLLGTAAAEYKVSLLWFVLIIYGGIWCYSIKNAYQDFKKAGCFWIIIFLLAAFFGFYNSYCQNAFRSVYESHIKDGEICFVQGEVTQRKQENKSCLYYLKSCKMQLHKKNYSCNQILLYLNTDKYSIGEILCVKGKIKTFDLPQNEGNYNERAYYQSLKIDFQVEGDKILSVQGKKNVWKEWLFSLKEKMKNSYENAMPKADAGVLSAMVLGDKGLMDAERKSLYQDAGISHFYSISGLHISMIGMALYHFLRKRGCSYLISGVTGAVLILWYGEFIGFGISASRAIGMFLILLYGKFRGRSYDRVTALPLMAAILTLENPFLFHHAGFLLSFGAVAGVILAEVILPQKNEKRNKKKGFQKYLYRFLDSGCENLMVSICIQMVTIPIMCQFFYEISVYSIFVNCVILPCMGILLGMGILGGIAGCLFPFAGKILLFVCYLILILFSMVCRFFLKFPYASFITGTMSVGELFIWYGFLVVFLLFRYYGKRWNLLGLILPFVLLLILPKSKDFALHFLDVGQGDGIYLTTGDGTDIFIDGGSADVSKVGTYRILPFLKYKGVKSIDYWFVSHCDTDHISGLLEIIEADYQVKNLVVSKYILKDEAWLKLRELAEKNEIQILAMGEGDTIKSKSQKNSWNIQSLMPEDKSSLGDRNENSFVILLKKNDFKAFFAGDIGMEEEKKLIQKWNQGNIDVYKVSHHGSKYSNCEEILNVLKPRLSVISCGRKNTYGHPHKETLERLKQAESKVYTTIQGGEIVIENKNGKISVMEYKKAGC